MFVVRHLASKAHGKKAVHTAMAFGMERDHSRTCVKGAIGTE